MTYLPQFINKKILPLRISTILKGNILFSYFINFTWGPCDLNMILLQTNFYHSIFCDMTLSPR